MKKLSESFADQLEAAVKSDVKIQKHDRFLSKDQFNGMNKNMLMAAEIHQLFEDDMIDLVVDENNVDKACALHVCNDGTRVLVIDTRTTYQAWREVYDEIQNA